MMRVLGCWYSTAQIHPKLLQSSLASIDVASRAARIAQTTVKTCTWERIPGNPFAEYVSHYRQPSHLGIVMQIARILFEEQEAGRAADLVCFLEHDVLYPHDYFDQIATVFVGQDHLRGVRNENYIGMNGTGWLRVRSRREPPLHQLSLTWDAALDHIDALLRRCILQGVVTLEPALSSDIAACRLPLAGPACHMNHPGQFTNHSDCYELHSRGCTTHDYWGDFQQFYPSGAARPLKTPNSGVVIGHFDRVRTLELNIRAIRAHCGPHVPILISDDCSPGFGVTPPIDSAFGRVLELAREYSHVTVWPNVERIGHTGGDMAAFWKALVWAHQLGLDVVFKLSQRYIIDRPNWVDESARELFHSGASTLGRSCADSGFPVRTEAVGLKVALWHRPDVLAHLSPRRVKWPTELIIGDDLFDRLDGRLHPWNLVTEGRFSSTPDALFHTANHPEDYRQLADRLGMPRGPEEFEDDQGDYRIG